jgi:hypothetical protein
MNPVRLAVVVRGKGYIAQSSEPEITALGKTAQDAAENARRMAESVLGKDAHRMTLLLRVDEPGVSTIVMQPLANPISLNVIRGDRDWHYVASVEHR